MNKVKRRAFLATGAVVASQCLAPRVPAAEPAATGRKIGLGFSLYGMKSLEIGAALSACADIGYDCVELTVFKGWPTDSAIVAKPARKRIQKQLDATGLRLSALMENLRADVDDAEHKKNLDRLRAAAELGRALSPDDAPVIETVLGGRPDEWEKSQQRIVDRLVDWARIGGQSETVIAIKAHVGGAMHLPEHPAWVAGEVESAWLKCAYDFSHFELRGVDMAASIRRLVPQSVFIHVKDSRGEPGKVQFLLPGEGKIDYVSYLKQVAAAGYRGDVVVEVSSQIHRRAEYEPIAAAKKSYEHLAEAFRKAGIARG